MAENIDRELGWDDEIEKESEFTLLKEGDYNFRIETFERSRYQGGDKIPPCNMAIVHIHIDSPEGSTTIQHRLYLHTKCEGLLSAFFGAIGQKQKGERISMNWNKVPGSTGRCRIKIREYTNKNGEKQLSNQISKFYPKDNKPAFKAGSF